MMKQKLALLLTALLLLTGCSSGGSGDTADGQDDGELETIDVVLDWYPNAVHAFLYEAEEKGYFAEEGLQVNILFPSNASDPLTMTAAGRADIGFYYQEDTIIARANEDVPVKVLGAVVQQPISIVCALAEKNIKTPEDLGPEYLLVDGYNIIFAWDELKAIARDNLDAARKSLMDLLSNYQGFRKNRVILVFDAYKVPDGQGSVSQYEGIFVVYTKERQTADAYIEKTTYELRKEERVRVVTSDNAEQLIILGHGALRVSASAFHQEVESAEGQIADILRRNNQSPKTRAVQAALEKAKKTEP